MRHIILLLCFTCLSFFTSFSQALTPHYVAVRAVHDGDSYKVFDPTDSTIYWVRIAGIDCPEVYSPYVPKEQPYGIEAGNYARKEYRSTSGSIKTYGTDKYNRVKAILTIRGEDIAENLLTNGYAWYVYDRKLPKTVRAKYKALEADARARKAGLWAGAKPDATKYTKPVSPATWRKKHPPMQPIKP